MPGNIISLTPETIAAWPKSNYVHPYERPGIPAIMWVFCALATLLVGTRLWLRTRAKILGLDDLFLAISWLVMFGYTICGNLIVSLSMANRHMWDIPPTKFTQLVLFVWLGEQGMSLEVESPSPCYGELRSVARQICRLLLPGQES